MKFITIDIDDLEITGHITEQEAVDWALKMSQYDPRPFRIEHDKKTNKIVITEIELPKPRYFAAINSSPVVWPLTHEFVDFNSDHINTVYKQLDGGNLVVLTGIERADAVIAFRKS